MTNLILFLALAAVAALCVGLIVTWYNADDEPVFGRGTPDRVTFKQVLQNFFRDVAAITRPVWMRVWLNAPVVAIVALDAVALMQEDMRSAIWQNPWGATALIALNLLARYGATPAHGPVASR